MGIKLGSKPIIAFKGDHEPVNMAKGNTRVTGWRRELLSGTELSFYNTYKDSVSLSIEGNTKVSDEVYREKTGKTVVIPASEHKKSNADKVLISGNTVQMSDWYGVNGQSSQVQKTQSANISQLTTETMHSGKFVFEGDWLRYTRTATTGYVDGTPIISSEVKNLINPLKTYRMFIEVLENTFNGGAVSFGVGYSPFSGVLPTFLKQETGVKYSDVTIRMDFNKDSDYGYFIMTNHPTGSSVGETIKFRYSLFEIEKAPATYVWSEFEFPSPSPENPSPVVSNLPVGTYKYTSTDGIYEFTLGEELRGIGDVTDKVVFDRVSKRGFTSRRLKVTTLDGTAPWSISSQPNDTTLVRFVRQISDLKPNYHYNIMCSGLPLNDKTDFALTSKECVSTHTPASNGQINVWLKKSRLTSVDAPSFKEWLTNNNFSIVYEKSESKMALTFTKVSSSTAPEVPMQFITSEVSPDYPAGMYDVEEGNIIVGGKNLVNDGFETIIKSSGASKITLLNGNVDIANTQDPATAVIYYPHEVFLRKGVDYTLSKKPDMVLGQSLVSVGFIPSDKPIDVSNFYTSVENRALTRFGYTGSDYTFTPIWTGYYRLGVYLAYNRTAFAVSNIGFNLSIGSSSSVYEAFQSQLKSTTPLLRKVGTVADTYNPLTGEYVQRVGVEIFNGTEDWTLFRNNAEEDFIVYSIRSSIMTGSAYQDTVKATHINFLNGQYANSKYTGLTSWTGVSKDIMWNWKKTIMPDLLSYKSWLSKNAEMGTPLKVYGLLETPIVTYLEPNLIPLYDVDTYIESDSAIAQPDITVGYELKDGVATNINDITEPHPDYHRVIDGVGEYDAVNDDYNLEVYSGVGGSNLYDGSVGTYVSDTFYGWQSYKKTMLVGYGHKIKHGETLTLSAYLKPETQNTGIMAHFETSPSGYIQMISNFIQAGSEGLAKITFDVPQNATSFRSALRHQSGSTPTDTVQYKEFKLERGTQATPWTPAPEDIQYNTPTNNTFKTLHNFPIEMNRIGDIADEYTPPFWGAGYDGDGRNLAKRSMIMSAGSVSTGITPTKLSSNELQVDVVPSNGNWHTNWFNSTEGIESSFVEGEAFTISFLMKSSVAGAKIPQVYIKSGLGYFNMQGSLTTEYSQVHYSGKWKKANPLAPHLGWAGCSGTYFIKAWKIERGSTPTPWTPSSGEFVQRIEKRIMTGVESFSIVDGYTGHYRFNMGVPVKPNTNIVCSHFKDGNTGLGVNIASVHGSSQLVMFCPSTNLIPSTSKWNDWLTQQYTIGNPVTLYYVLNTPILSTITGSAIPTFFPATKVEVLTDVTKPKLHGTARVVDLLETDF